MMRIACLTSLFILLTLCASAQPDEPGKRPPNVVILYGDDVGFGDVGVYGSKMIPTPRIDALAAQGLRFTDAHCAAATCTPSRYSMLTGEMAFRQPGTGIAAPNSNSLIKANRFTLPDLFKQAGYTTAVIGKWHLGLDDEQPIQWNGTIDPSPEAIGFDHHFILPTTNDRVPSVYVSGGKVLNLDPNDPITISPKPLGDDVPGTAYPNGRTNPEAMTKTPGDHQHACSVTNGISRIWFMKGGKSALWKDEDIADDFVAEAGKWIEKNKDKPFFLFFPTSDIHVPRYPHKRFWGKSELGLRGDAMVSFDWSCGAIVDLLEKHGLTESTIVIVGSDNGPVYDDGYKDGTETKKASKASDRGHFGAGQYRGGKYSIYEGGTRTPFIVRWPGKVEPGVSDALFSQTDLMGSFAAMLDRDIPEGEGMDSRDEIDTLLGKDKVGSEVILVQTNNSKVALRYKQWKYIPGKNAELYDLSKDIGEKNNLVNQQPGMAQKLGEMMQTYRKQGLAE
ncbi:MAG: sulfatase-like hydrolase/transferase [Phycisphaeraceae bacterium]|nr:sulfatase-like hydrolase/transferase [Phycisphaeraceae bacterium]